MQFRPPVTSPVLPSASLPQPPPSRIEVVTDVLHGTPVADPYRWLECQESPETRAWIEAQNAYSRSFLDAIPGVDRLRARLTELVRQDDISAPTVRGSRHFLSRRLACEELHSICVREGLHGSDEVLLDPSELSQDLSRNIVFMGVSEDGRLLLWGVREHGQDEHDVRFMGVDERTDIAPALPAARYGGVSLTPDGTTVYYSVREEMGTRVYRHEVGAEAGSDTYIFGEEYGPDCWVSGWVSEDGRWLLISAGRGWGRDDLYLKDLRGDGPIITIVKDVEASFSPFIADGKLFVYTNW